MGADTIINTIIAMLGATDSWGHNPNWNFEPLVNEKNADKNARNHAQGGLSGLAVGKYVQAMKDSGQLDAIMKTNPATRAALIAKNLNAMRHTFPDSTWIRELWYDPRRGEAKMKCFNNHKTYVFPFMNPNTYKEWTQAPSKGKFYWDRLAPRYRGLYGTLGSV